MLLGTVTVSNNVIDSAPRKQTISFQGEYLIVSWDHKNGTVSKKEYLLTVLWLLFLSSVINNNASR